VYPDAAGLSGLNAGAGGAARRGDAKSRAAAMLAWPHLMARSASEWPARIGPAGDQTCRAAYPQVNTLMHQSIHVLPQASSFNEAMSIT
jgi:hypothetical protein